MSIWIRGHSLVRRTRSLFQTPSLLCQQPWTVPNLPNSTMASPVVITFSFQLFSCSRVLCGQQFTNSQVGSSQNSKGSEPECRHWPRKRSANLTDRQADRQTGKGSTLHLLLGRKVWPKSKGKKGYWKERGDKRVSRISVRQVLSSEGRGRHCHNCL